MKQTFFGIQHCNVTGCKSTQHMLACIYVQYIVLTIGGRNTGRSYYHHLPTKQ